MCLSNTYTCNSEPMLWRCSEGHEWLASLANVKNAGTWCPHCNTWKREEECRAVFEELLGVSFPRCRPSFLDGLELDGFNAELRLAFEHQGLQHYEQVPFFRPAHDDFEALVGRDAR